MKRLAVLSALLTALAPAGSSFSAQLSEGGYVVDKGPVWSPDGTRIAFLRSNAGNWSVRAVAASGGAVDLLGELPAARRDPNLLIKLSPDWSKVAYQHGAVVRIDDVGRSESREVPVGPVEITWSPDSRFLAITGIPADVYVAHADGSGLRKVADGFAPAWSPDGTELAVVLPFSVGLAVVGRDGTGYREIWQSSFATGIPAWAPSGDMIAFMTGFSLQVVRTDGTPVRTFNGASATNLPPSWSFDSSKIAFASGNALSVFDVRDGALKRFPFAHEVAWAPHSLDFAAALTGPCSFAGIHVVSAASRAIRRLTNDCRILGSNRSELLEGTEFSDVILGLRGDDRIAGFADSDELFGGPGNDRITGGPYPEDDADLIDGGRGNDVLDGGRGQQSQYSARDDVLRGRSGSDVLRGGPGRDLLDGGGGNDTVWARDGERDEITCGRGRDLAFVDRLDRRRRDCETVRVAKR